MVKPATVDEYFAGFAGPAREHLDELRRLSRTAAPRAIESLKWGCPAYIHEDGVTLFMLCGHKRHGSRMMLQAMRSRNQGPRPIRSPVSPGGSLSTSARTGTRSALRRRRDRVIVLILRRPLTAVVVLLVVLAISAAAVRSVTGDSASGLQRDNRASIGWTQVDPLRWPSEPLKGVQALAGAATTDPLAGGVVVVNFWASWCAPCREEMPVLQRVAQQGDVKVLGVSTDARVGVAAETLRSREVTYPNLVDTQGHLREAVGTHSPIVALPSSLLIVDGEIRAIHLGVFETLADIDAGVRAYSSG